MAFSSIPFLCCFFPITVAVYFLIPKKAIAVRNVFLMAVSLIFYAYGEPVYVLLMLFCTLWNYLCTLLFSSEKLAGNAKKRKVILLVTCIVDLLILGFFKYTGMIVTTINSAIGVSIPVPAITLPIGISFFTFQAMSYTIDVYRGNAKAENRFFKVLLYISFFHSICASLHSSKSAEK